MSVIAQQTNDPSDQILDSIAHYFTNQLGIPTKVSTGTPSDTSQNTISYNSITGAVEIWNGTNSIVINQDIITTIANTYSDNKDIITLNTANLYSDTNDITILNLAKGYADAQDTTNLTTAESYTDTKFLSVASGVLPATTTTNPTSTPTIFTYFATVAGTYTNFSSIIVTSGDLTSSNIYLVSYNNGSTWNKIVQPITVPLATTFNINNSSQAVSPKVINDFLVETPTSINFSVSSSYSIINSTITNPSTRYNTAVDVNGYFQINQVYTNILLIGMLIPDNNPTNKVYDTQVSFDSVTANTGFGICINPSSSTTIDTTGHISLIWRSNGTLTVYQQNGMTVATSIIPVFNPAINTSLPPVYSASDVLRMVLKYGTDNTAATLTLFVNNVKSIEYSVTNLPVGYMGVTTRNIAVGTVTSRIRSFVSTYLQEKVRNIHIDAAAANGGDGSFSKPFNDTKLALLKVSESNGDFNLYFGDGIYRTSLQFPAYKYRNIGLYSKVAGNTIILASELVTSGWTKTTGQTNIWERPHVFEGAVNSNNAGGGFIDITNSSVIPSGITLPYTIYQRLSPNGSLATLDTTPGASMVNTTTKIIYIHAIGNVDPNTLQLEYANHQFGFGLLIGNTTDNYYTNVIIKGITFKYAYSHNVGITRGNINLHNVKCYGSLVSNGFGLDDSVGNVYSCIADGNYNDGFNAKGGNNLGDYHTINFYNCVGRNNLVGDGMSNHDGTWNAYQCTFRDNGKDGFIPTGNANVSDCTFINNTAGFQLYPNPLNLRDSTATLYNCIFISNRESGIHCEAGTVAPYGATITANNCLFINNAKAIWVFNTTGTPSRTVININNALSGGGNTLTIVNNGGIINQPPITPLI